MKTSMTNLERGHAENITISQETKTTWAIVNPKYSEGHYTVREGSGGRFTCNCTAGFYGRDCKHIALVVESLTPPPVRITDTGWREAYAQLALLDR
jgi:hypothetical protein